jgi:hypothetical protein
MEKMSEEMLDKLFEAEQRGFGTSVSSDQRRLRINAYREAGLLAPAETPYEKAPLGLMPEWLWIEKRIESIEEAMNRYDDKGKPIPGEWMNELDSLKCRLKTSRKTETAYEKAQRLWEEWEREPGYGITYEAAIQIVPALLAEIDRLKWETWDNDDMWWAHSCMTTCDVKSVFIDRLAARRAAKAKE